MLCTVLQDAPEVELFFPDTVFVDSVSEGYVGITQGYGTVDSILWITNGDTTRTTATNYSCSFHTAGIDSIAVVVFDDDGNAVRISQPAVAATLVSGEFTGKFIFNRTLSPFIIRENILFRDSIIVESGTDIVFRGGTAECMSNIAFNGLVTDSIHIFNCRFSVKNSSNVNFSAEYCHITGNNRSFLEAYVSFKDFTLRNSYIDNFSTFAIWLLTGDIDISYNYFISCGNFSISPQLDNSYRVSHNDFNENSTSIILELDQTNAHIDVDNNNFFPPVTYILTMKEGSSGTCNFTNNYALGITDIADLNPYLNIGSGNTISITGLSAQPITH